MSSIVELRENIVDKVIDLGVSLDFLENPAFVVALAEVNNLISQMNIEDPGVVLVDESNDSLSFTYTSSSGDNYKMDISCPDSKTVKCVRVEEPHSFVGESGNVVRQKNVVEQVAKLDEHGGVTLFTNCGSIDNVDCDNHHYNMNSSVERRVYTTRGVMYEREHKNYATRKGEGYFHRVGADEMLLLARQAFDYGPWADSYDKRSLLVRELLDTARLVYDDRRTGNDYYGVVPLHQEHGLRDMFIANGYNTFPVADVEIHPLMEGEIAEMIARESNPKVAEGLKYFANGRTSYYYTSNESGEYSGAKAM